MPTPIRILDLMRRLQARFNFHDTPANLWMPDSVQLVQDIDKVLELPSGSVVTNCNLSAGAGAFYTVDTVPVGKKWRIMSASREGTTAASRLAIRLNQATVTAYISNSQTGADTIYPGYMVLLAGDLVGALTTGNGADNSRRVEYHYVESDMSE